ncbi:MAG TPA: hypothetical protein VMW35_03510 [Myxococcota bacterium]|nr:hypothetical protein [Myxococcota bacterium]
MQTISGLVTALILLLSLVIGVRLLQVGGRSKGPERWLGVYFLAASLLGTIFSSVLYMGWVDPTLELPAAWRPPLQALHIAAHSAGLFGIWMFTWRTFRPDSTSARGVVLGVALVLVASFVLIGIDDHFAVHIVPGPVYWFSLAVRVAGVVWMSAESFRYGALLRRRLRLGLADPLVANRFVLWGIWAAAVTLLNLSDPLARAWYCAVAGTTTVLVPEVARQMIVIVMAVTSALGIVAAACLFLTFFPTAAYRRWVLARQPATQA